MNLKEILELIDKVADRGISLVEVERAGLKVRIEGKRAEPVVAMHASPSAQGGGASATSPVPEAQSSAPAVPAEDEIDPAWHIITSPIVGTFYRAPNPESDPFVKVGDHISKGAVLCIVEAMKLMNEIESDSEGWIAKIFPQNGQPVEYGEKLFAVKI